MVKIFVVTQEEPFYIPKVIRYIIENSGKKYEILGYTCLPPQRKNRTFKDWFFERTRIYDYRELFIVGLLFVYCNLQKRIIAKVTGKNFYSVAKTFKEFGLKAIETNDINSSSYLSRLKNLNADIIISISCPQLFGKELLAVPKKYCLNVHGTLLPRHRGVFGSWWTIFLDDKEAGATIHTMELKLDAGNILWQQEFEVEKEETQYSIANKTKRMMAIGLVEILNKNAKNELQSISSKYQQSYHKAPTKEEGKEFHRKGMRIIKPGDIKNVLRNSFNFTQ